MLNSPVFSGLCQPRPIYIKGLIPSPAHFSAPGKSPRRLFLVCKDCLVRGKVLPGSALAAAQADRGHLQGFQHQPHVQLSPIPNR